MPYTYFNSDKRDVLQTMIAMALDITVIAGILAKHRSSLYREISQHKTKNYYIASIAHVKAQSKRYESKPLHKQNNHRLMADIKRRFKKDHSPEQIAGRLKLENPEDKEKHVSTETIYKYLYNSLQQEPELRKYFRQGQKKRHKRLLGKHKRGCIPNRKFIGERPLIVETKSRLGDWEGDTIEGAGKKGYIANFVDRKTKFLRNAVEKKFGWSRRRNLIFLVR